ncbi:hypothetical protein HOLleu_27225 [Holothuria leucospilota]|uniref:Uncharacterized protein n=1 Tax=Holothuria leucospilota TaxID=206669 RepID=A0A9Q1BQ02_HOLLE|nr:hypothetical protein HOLleu_27225 [Holothuria leucospilota]
MLRERTQLFLVEVKGHLRSLEVRKQNFPRIPKIVVTRSEKAKFPNNFQDCHGVTRRNKARIPKCHLGSLKVGKQNSSRIPKIIVWGHEKSKRKISQEFPRLSSGVTRGQKAKFPKNFQDPRSTGGQRSFEVIRS